MPRSALHFRLAILLVALFCTLPDCALAIGWGPTDFLIGGGPSFTTRIGVFDSNLNFKGYLDNNFITVAGMDFDAHGHLVAVASAAKAVRVYDSSGTLIGGFSRTDNSLGNANDLAVAPNGDYIVATDNSVGGDGAREFAPDGTFIRQYGSGAVRAAAVLPGNHLWLGGVGSSSIGVFDLASGAQIDSIAVAGPTGFRSFSYSDSSNTVLANSGGSIWELDTAGNVVRSFSATGRQGFNDAVRGPGEDLLASDSSQNLFRWHADTSFVGSYSMSASLGFPYAMEWAGNAPEPSALVAILGPLLVLRRSFGKSARRQS